MCFLRVRIHLNQTLQLKKFISHSYGLLSAIKMKFVGNYAEAEHCMVPVAICGGTEKVFVKTLQKLFFLKKSFSSCFCCWKLCDRVFRKLIDRKVCLTNKAFAFEFQQVLSFKATKAFLLQTLLLNLLRRCRSSKGVTKH